MNKVTTTELKRLQSLSLEEKEAYALDTIKEFVSYFARGYFSCCVSFSGGLDSTVLLHLTRRLYPDMLAVFCNTTNEYPELVKFVKKTRNVKILTPNMNYKQVVEKYGFPLVSKKVTRSINDLRSPTQDNPNIRNLYLTGLNRKANFVPSYKLAKKWYYLFDKQATPFDITNICCDILKKEPIERFRKKSGLNFIVGTLASESQQRKTNFLKYGANILDSKSPKSRPLSIFTDDDIWAYIKKYDIPYCELYDDKVLEDGTIIKGETTTGCVACGMGCHLEKEDRFEKLKLRRPRLYKNIMKMKNNGISFKEAINHIKNPNPTFKTDTYKKSIYLKGMQDLENCTLQYKLKQKEVQMANDNTKNNETNNLDNHDNPPMAQVDAVTLMRQSNSNLIETGATCADLKVVQGGAIIDKETKKQKVDSTTGELQFYNDKYYAILTFDGGETQTEITKAQHDLLEIGGRYLCKGRLGKVRTYVNGGMAEIFAPIYHSFTRLY